MAWISFWLILIVGGSMIGFGMSSDEVVARIDKLSFIVGSLFGVWGGIVLAYFGASAYTDKNDLKYNAPIIDSTADMTMGSEEPELTAEPNRRKRT